MIRALAPTLVLGLACAGAPTPDPVPPVGADEPGGAPPRASCSAAGLDPTPAPQPALTDAAAETRRRIVAAAVACDVDALADLAGPGFTYSFGGGGDPAGYWRDAEARGEPVLGTLVRLLALAPHVTDDRAVWPRAYADPPPSDARAELEAAFGVEQVAGWYAGDQYLGWRTAIGPDGRWQFFVAGD